jgi:hypothetical protein
VSSYSDYANAASDILLKKGEAAARAKEQTGQIWGSTIATLGQTIPKQVQDAMAAGAQKRKLVQFQQVIQQNGGDLEKSLPILYGIDAHMAGQVADDHAKVQESVAKVTKIKQDAEKAKLDWADELWGRVNDPGSYARAVLASQAVGDTSHPAEYDPAHVKQVQQGIIQQKLALQPPRAPTEASLAADLSSPDPVVRDRATKALDRLKPAPVAGGAKTVTELRIDAANPNSPTRDQSAQILANMPPSETVSSAAEDERYRVINAKPPQARTPDERAWSAAYEKQKTLGVDTSASFAANRQAQSIAAQTAQQQRAQAFTESQAGRKELTDKVEQPYQTAQAGVDTLRETIQAAKDGNVVAGQLQSLLTTMATLKAEGFNRINTAEINATGDAGSMFQRVEGWFSHATAGQPIPASVQKDMANYADILEKAAYKKYQSGFQTTTKRYGLSDEQPLPPPASVTAQPPPGVTTPSAGGFDVTAPNGKTYHFATKGAAEAFKARAGIK